MVGYTPSNFLYPDINFSQFLHPIIGPQSALSPKPILFSPTIFFPRQKFSEKLLECPGSAKQRLATFPQLLSSVNLPIKAHNLSISGPYWPITCPYLPQNGSKRPSSFAELLEVPTKFHKNPSNFLSNLSQNFSRTTFHIFPDLKIRWVSVRNFRECLFEVLQWF